MATQALTSQESTQAAQATEYEARKAFYTAKKTPNNEKKTAIALRAWQKATKDFYDAAVVFQNQSYVKKSAILEQANYQKDLAENFRKRFDRISLLTRHKNDMAVGVALSVVITAAAIAAIATAMIFCPPAGLTALALGLTFGVLGGVGSLSLLGIVHFSIRLHVAKFAANTLKNIFYDYKLKGSNEEIISRANRLQIADACVAPWMCRSICQNRRKKLSHAKVDNPAGTAVDRPLFSE